MTISKIDQLPSIGHTVKSDTWIEKPENDDPSVDNNVFQFSGDGGDEYYPCGGYIVNMDLFKPTARRLSARPVWIVSGDSGTGKSFLASKLGGMVVYETDSCKDLPEIIFADVIVVGNKCDHGHGEIVKRIFGEHKLINVNFGN